MATLITYKKTQNQEDKLLTLVLCEDFIKVVSKPTLTNNNLLVKLTDIVGREFFKELTPEGNLTETVIWF